MKLQLFKRQSNIWKGLTILEYKAKTTHTTMSIVFKIYIGIYEWILNLTDIVACVVYALYSRISNLISSTLNGKTIDATNDSKNNQMSNFRTSRKKSPWKWQILSKILFLFRKKLNRYFQISRSFAICRSNRNLMTLHFSQEKFSWMNKYFLPPIIKFIFSKIFEKIF